jgi:hypothetical protein
MSNLLLTVLDKAGVPTHKLGDSTGFIQPDCLAPHPLFFRVTI